MSFYDEIKNYSIEDLLLIIETQQDLYTEEEMAQIKELLNKKTDEAIIKELRKKALEEERQKVLEKKRATLPLACPKCDGPNKRSDEVCVFCGAKLDKNIVYEKDLNGKSTLDSKTDSSQSRSFFFQYIISFLIPLAGFIMGGIMTADKDSETSSAGKTCIIIAVFSVILAVVTSIVTSLITYNYYMNLFQSVLQ
ncbi:MAG: hypothetical protein J6C61_01435 [Clostridia bacterium]|nr:hypothetical protein [Clostridia bacterium]